MERAGNTYECVAGQLEGKSEFCRASLETNIINGSYRAIGHDGMDWNELIQMVSATLLQMQ